MAQFFHDDFNRANGALGADWSAAGSPAPVIFSNQWVGPTLGNWSGANYQHYTDTTDHTVKVVIGAMSTGDCGIQLNVRNGANNMTLWWWDGAAPTFTSWPDGTLRATGSNTSFTTGDVISFSAIGTWYTLKKNGSTVLQWEDWSGSFSYDSGNNGTLIGFQDNGANNHGFDEFWFEDYVPPISALYDDFNSGSAKWNTYTGGGGSISFAGNQLRISHPATTAYPNVYIDPVRYDFTGGGVFVQLVDAGDQSITSHQALLKVALDGSNMLSFYVENGNIGALKVVGGTQTNLGSTTYNQTAHRWLRIRESGGTIYFGTSPDGYTWTDQWSLANPFAVTAIRVELLSGAWQVEAAGSYATFDNFNIVPPVSMPVPMRIPNPRVGPMALRNRSRFKPPPAARTPVSHTADASLVVAATGLESGLPYTIPPLLGTALVTATVGTGSTNYNGTSTATSLALTLTADGYEGDVSSSTSNAVTLALTSVGVVGEVMGVTATTATLALTSAGTLGATTTAASLALSLTAAGIEGDVAGDTGIQVTLANTAIGVVALSGADSSVVTSLVPFLVESGTIATLNLTAAGSVSVPSPPNATPIRPANPKVGPMALRNLWRRRPQTTPQFDGYVLPDSGMPISVGLTAGGAVTGNASTAIGLTLTANGAQDYSPRVWPQYPNSNVGPMALRQAWHPRPKSVPQVDGLVQPEASVPVQFGSVGTGNNALNTVHSWTHVIASDDNFLVVIIGHDGAANPVYTGTVGTKPLDFLGVGYHGYDGNYIYAVMMCCFNPPTGTQTVTVTGPNSYGAANSISYKNVGGWSFTHTDAQPAGNNKYIAVTSSPGQMVVAGFEVYTGTLGGFFPNQRFVIQYVPSQNLALIAGDAYGGTTNMLQAVDASGGNGFGAVALTMLPVPSLPLAFTLTAGGNLTRATTPIAITATLTSAGTIAVTSIPDSITVGLSAAGRLGAAVSDPGVTVTTTGDGQLSVIGAKPVIIPNPNVGPMALRNTWHWRPKSQFKRDGWLGSSTELPASVNTTGDGATNTVTFDAVGTGAAVTGTTVNWTHNIQGNYLIVAVQEHRGWVAPTFTVTVGSTNVPLLSTTLTYLENLVQSAEVSVYGLANPPTGTQTITFTSTVGVDAVMNSISYNNVGAIGAVTFSNTGAGSTGNKSTGATATSARQMVFNMFGAWDGTLSNAWSSYTASLRSNQPVAAVGKGALLIGDSQGGTSTTFTATVPAADAYGAYTIPLFPYVGQNTTVSLNLTADGLIGTVGSAPTTVSLALTSIGVVTAPAALPVRIPNPFVGPMALRQRRRPRIPPYPIRLDGYTVNDAGTTLAVGLTAGGAASGDATTDIGVTPGGYGYTAVYSPANPDALTVTTTADGILGLQVGAPTSLALSLTADAVEGKYAGASTALALGLTTVGSLGILQSSLATALAVTPTAAGGGSGNATTTVSVNLLASGGGAGGGSTTVTWNSIAFGRRGIFADASLSVTASRTANVKWSLKAAATLALTAARTPALTRGGLVGASLAVTAGRTVTGHRVAYVDASRAVTVALTTRFKQAWLADAELSVSISEVFPYTFPFVFERSTTAVRTDQKISASLAVAAGRPSIVGFPRAGGATLTVTSTRTAAGTKGRVVGASQAVTATGTGGVKFGARAQTSLGVSVVPNGGAKGSLHFGSELVASVSRPANATYHSILDVDVVTVCQPVGIFGQAQRISAHRGVTVTLPARLKLSAPLVTSLAVTATTDALTPGASSNFFAYYLA